MTEIQPRRLAVREEQRLTFRGAVGAVQETKVTYDRLTGQLRLDLSRLARGES